MNEDPKKRPDFSKYLVHLTRDTDSVDAEINLINILKCKTIEARNFHCLFAHKIEQMDLSDFLTNKFKTVCFTETPLAHIHKMTSENYNRKIKLRPFGLVFSRQSLIEKGASPAIYINNIGSNIQDYLINEFNKHFDNINKFKTLKTIEPYYNELIQYYSLVNTIAKNYDFCWEREWRFNGDLPFLYRDIIAIVVEEPDAFEKHLKDILTEKKYSYIRRIPIISAYWDYEEVVEQFSSKLWNNKTIQ